MTFGAIVVRFGCVLGIIVSRHVMKVIKDFLCFHKASPYIANSTAPVRKWLAELRTDLGFME